MSRERILSVRFTVNTVLLMVVAFGCMFVWSYLIHFFFLEENPELDQRFTNRTVWKFNSKFITNGLATFDGFNCVHRSTLNFSVLDLIRNETLDAEQHMFENSISTHFLATIHRHEIMERYPIKSIPIIIETKSGLCLLGSVCSTAVVGQSHWVPDPHIRDVIISVLLKCSIRNLDCFMIDVGSNIGSHSLAAMELGVMVVGIEPQTDLCVVSRLSAALSEHSDKSHFICGGVSPTAQVSGSKLHVNNGMHRYGGSLESLPYKLQEVSLHPLHRLLGGRRVVNFLKIDTDSIDCHVLQQAIDLMKTDAVRFEAVVLETWDTSCTNNNLIGKQLVHFFSHNYSIYRTLVWERSWDNQGRDYENDYKNVVLPFGWIERFHVGFNFVLWQVTDSLSAKDLELHPTKYPNWQYVMVYGTNFIKSGYRTLEL
jgi:FkbM family methyltransferase